MARSIENRRRVIEEFYGKFYSWPVRGTLTMRDSVGAPILQCVRVLSTDTEVCSTLLRRVAASPELNNSNNNNASCRNAECRIACAHLEPGERTQFLHAGRHASSKHNENNDNNDNNTQHTTTKHTLTRGTTIINFDFDFVYFTLCRDHLIIAIEGVGIHISQRMQQYMYMCIRYYVSAMHMLDAS